MKELQYNSFKEVPLGFTFDDLLLRPAFSKIASRKDTSIRQNVFGIDLETPIIPANMSTICGEEMVKKTVEVGGTACLHRFLEPEEYARIVIDNHLSFKKAGISLGLSAEWNDAVLNVLFNTLPKAKYPPYVIIDVAHGYHERVLETVSYLRKNYDAFDPDSGIKIVVGNFCTGDAVRFFMAMEENLNDNYRVHGFKVGVGPGAVCTTRRVTGCGFPQLSAIKSIAYEASRSSFKKIVIADGGIKDSGDIVKAIAAGAHLVMVGSLFAGADETPGQVIETKDAAGKFRAFKRYAGMASREEHGRHFGRHFHAPEGVANIVEVKGPAENIFKRLNWGIRSGLSYCGCKDLDELREYGDNPYSWIRISPAGLSESVAHFQGM